MDWTIVKDTVSSSKTLRECDFGRVERYNMLAIVKMNLLFVLCKVDVRRSARADDLLANRSSYQPTQQLKTRQHYALNYITWSETQI
jgi:hypothetical protein